MRLLIIALLFLPLAMHGQNNIFATVGVSYTSGAPTFTPGGRGSLVAFDTISGDWYVSLNRFTDGWAKLGERLQSVSGCTAPTGVPPKWQSEFVINSCATPEMYLHTGGGTWVCLNCAASGATNLSFTQLTDSTYQLNSSTGSDVTFKAGANTAMSLSGAVLTIQSTGGGGGGTVETDATLTGDGSIGSPLGIAQQSADASQVLEWSGAAWLPSWGNPYTYVTTGATITSEVNEVLVGTISADITIGLPTCNAALDGKHFKIIRNGTDAFSVKIDPSGGQTFHDGTAEKIFFGKLAIDCTCKHGGGSTWFFDNF